MCGIVGYMTAEDKIGGLARDEFMKQALIMGTLRGDDSTGVFASGVGERLGENPGWLKQLGPGYDLINSKDYDEFNKYYWKYKVGHNRAATKGRVNVDNAHPFQEGPITLVHNGTLWTTHGLPKTQHALGVDVDSHAICHNLALTEDPAEVIEKLDGAFALVWHDARDDSLNFVRNDERPFHMAEVTGQKTIFFMSEARMLDCVIGRMRGPDIRKIVQPKVGQYLKFKANDLFNPEIRELNLEKSWGNYGRSWNGYGGYGNTGYDRDYDDDDSWDALAGGSRPKAPTVPNNKVPLGGREREVPDFLQEELMELDLQVEDRLPFCPTHFKTTIPGKNPRGIVSGYHPTSGLNMALYGVTEDLWKRSGERVWMVRPIAVKYLHDEQPKPLVICRMVSTVHKEYSLASFEDSSETEASDDAPFDLVEGPGGLFIPKSEWIDLASGGCISCQRPVYWQDDIIWVNEEKDPMCENCQEDWGSYMGLDYSWAD